MNKKSIFVILVLAMLFVPTALADRPHYIYDNAGVVDSAMQAKINEFGLAVDHATTAEIVIVTLKTLPSGQTVDQAKLSYFNDVPLDGVKGIGKSGKNNGVLILIVMDSHDWAFETGYGVEGNLTDAECGRIGRDIMVPLFQAGDFGGGLLAGMKAVAAKIGYNVTTITTIDSGTTIETTTDHTNTPITDVPWTWVVIGIIAVVIVIAIVAMSSGDEGGEGGGFFTGGSEGHGGGGGGFGGGGSGGGGAGGHWNVPLAEAVVSEPEVPLKDRTPDGHEKCTKCDKVTPYVVTDTHDDTEMKADGEYRDSYEEHMCQECGTATTILLSSVLVASLLELEARRTSEREAEEESSRRNREEEEEEESRRSSESSYHPSSFGGGISGGGGAVGKW